MGIILVAVFARTSCCNPTLVPAVIPLAGIMFDMIGVLEIVLVNGLVNLGILDRVGIFREPSEVDDFKELNIMPVPKDGIKRLGILNSLKLNYLNI